jgi:hypothetical protein
MSELLSTLERHRDLILLAEIGVLIHDLGKLSSEFIAAHAAGPRQTSFKHHLVLRRLKRGYHTSALDKNQLEDESQIPEDFLPDALLLLLDERTLTFPWVSGPEEVSLGDFVETHHLHSMPAKHAMALLAARSQGADGVDSGVDKADAKCEYKQSADDTRIATAFGYEPEVLRLEPEALRKVRKEYANNLALLLQQIKAKREDPFAGHKLPASLWQAWLYDRWQGQDGCWIPGLRELTQGAFRKALGETRRALNDVTLWDHSFSVASLYKAALAKILLEQARDPCYPFPEVKQLQWRLLRVGYDGLGFLEQAHHITDLLGRKADLEKALDEVKQTLEVEFPLGNEIYRDENGSAFLVPALDKDDERGTELCTLLQERVTEAFHQHLQGELVPALSISKASCKATELGELLAKRAALAADPSRIQQNWQGQVGAEICPICGLRPQRHVGKRDEARQSPLCDVCLARRGHRARAWAKDEGGLLGRTIWIDEVADENGRTALVVGRFGLQDWLNGSYVDTLSAAPCFPKKPSFARLRRVWETTQGFWQDVENQILNCVLREGEEEKPCPPKRGERWELTLDPPHPGGEFHVYEARLTFGNVPVVWDTHKHKLITATNLKTLGASWKEWIRTLPACVTLYEPSGDGAASEVGKFQVTAAERSATCYRPYVSLLAEPLVFMALLPAANALDAARAIRDRYEQEMGRVRDRLPLHLGLVFLDRHAPLYAALDAGRRMLALASEHQPWTVKQVEEGDLGRVVFQNDVVWSIPHKMGDGKTEDELYLGALRRPSPGTQIKVHPSHWEYIFLDTSTRRFDVRLEPTGRRPHPLFGPCYSPRPYLLEDLHRMDDVWDWCRPCGMTNTRLYGIRDLLAARFAAWDLAEKPKDGVEWGAFEGLVDQVLGKEFGYRSGMAEYEGLRCAILDGLFFDCLELYLQILKEEVRDER